MMPATPRTAAPVASSSTLGINPDDVKQQEARLCCDLSMLVEHYDILVHLPNKNKQVCSLCGILCCHCCTKCNKAIHHPSTTNDKAKHPCFIQWHNTMCFGLAEDDFKLIGSKKKDFEQPSAEKVLMHAVAMRRMKAELLRETAATSATTQRNSNTAHTTNVQHKRKKLTRAATGVKDGIAMTEKDKQKGG
jgi:hypothetical protein